jgi:DNA-binding HxlR family transcriptional regulator
MIKLVRIGGNLKMKEIYDCDLGCPVQNTLQFISGKWKSVILYHIFKNEVLRFSELQAKLPYVSKRMLAKQLSELEEDGILDKQIYPVIPVKTEYRVTELGSSLYPVIEAMEIWGTNYTHMTKS